MTPAQARRSLLGRRQALLSRRAEPVDGQANGRDEADRALATLRLEDTLASRERVTTELEAIDLALERIAAGTYGVCCDCGQPIAPKRLEKYPAVERCLTCQERTEHAAARLHARDRRPTPYPVDEEAL